MFFVAIPIYMLVFPLPDPADNFCSVSYPMKWITGKPVRYF